MDTLAAELKVSKKTIYKFFSTKEALAVAVYEKIYSEALGKIGGAFFGGKLTKADPHVTKYLGLTLLPHSGVSLIFTGDRRKYHNGDRSIACRHHLGNDRFCRDHQRDHRRTACKGGVPPRGRDRPAADAKTSPHRMTNRERGADTGAPLRSMEKFMCGHIFP